MNILHATTTPTLLESLKKTLAYSHTVRADIAVGYLFVSGFNAVAAELAQPRLEKIRILVGRADRGTLEEVARGMQQAEALQARVEGESSVRRSAREALGTEAARLVGEGVGLLPQTDEEQRGVRHLSDLIASGRVEIKTYPKGTLHAKAYLCWYKDSPEKGSAIVGSSNFTLAGFTGNTELNVRITGDAEMTTLGAWFDDLWADAIDVTAAIQVELQRSWAIVSTPPYHVYLKALYELYGDELGTPKLEPPKRGTPELANFQLDAVRRGLQIVSKHGGCFIGDVVGLGKTFIGAELVRQLQYEEPIGSNPLIICPAGLKSMWEGVSERFGLAAKVVSMSAIAPPAAARFDEEAGVYVDDLPLVGNGIDLLAEYPNRGVVLIDEVHNFRRDGTRRYAALSQYLWRGGDAHKVVMLSATPQNLGPIDIYHQLRLFLDEQAHGLNIEPSALRDYFTVIQRWYDYQLDVENWNEDVVAWKAKQQTGGTRKRGARLEAPPPPPTQPTGPYAAIAEVLNPTFIRRRRKDILELYGDKVQVAGKPVHFPEAHLDNVFYRLDKVYAKAGSFTDLQARLSQHLGARYLATEYLLPAARSKPEYKDLLRARNRVARLMRHLMLKRLESSVAAFRATLDTLARSNRNFRAALTDGVVPIGQTATALLSGESFAVDDLVEHLRAEEAQRTASGAKRNVLVHPGTDFDTARWLHDLDRDYALLDAIRTAVAQIGPEDDDKLTAVRQLLDKPEIRAGKILIFSEAEATVNYLYEQLNPGGVDPTIARLSGSNRGQLEQIVKRFSPKTNLRPREVLSDPPIRILIATDVISEGQNLQDCNRVLNYDLHWNPVRLIQRFGRVDRIGTTHDHIYLHNTWPDTDVDTELTLTERLIRRIQAFHDFIGLDSQLLSEQERLNPAAMYRIYEQQRLPEGDDVLDEVAAHQRGIAMLQKIKADEPHLWETVITLSDGIRAALPARQLDAAESAVVTFQRALAGMTVQLPLAAPQPEAHGRTPLDAPELGETVVLFKHGERASAYAVGEDVAARQITPGQLLAAMECGPTTPAAPLPPQTNERVYAAYRATRDEARGRLGRARRPGGDTRLRRYVSKYLRAAREEFADDRDELQRIGILQQIFLDHLPPLVLTELEEVRRVNLTGHALIRRLEALRERHRLKPLEDDESADDRAETEVVRTICSDGLIGRA